MKVYEYKTGEKAIFINNEKVAISNENARKIELFEIQIDNLNNDNFSTKIGTEKLITACDKYELLIKEEDGCEIIFLTEKGVPLSCIMNDSKNEILNDRLDDANMKMAFADFSKWVNM